MSEENKLQDYYEIFIDDLQIATGNIGPDYFLLPVAGSSLPVFRERVYCYELYHQLRLQREDHSKYLLCGELDKSGHREMRGRDITNTVPDFLVHVPGKMDNFAIVEVKCINARPLDIRKDLRRLTAFSKSGYHFAIQLIYGNDKRGIDRIIEIAKFWQGEDTEGRIDLSLIHLFWHRNPGDIAHRL
jgi:hypothetical protein